MILTCPSCSTRYFADDASLGRNARLVRCAACGHTWRARRARPRSPGSAASLAEAADAAALPAVGRPLAPGAPDMRAALMTWGAAVAVLIALTTAGLAFRVEVAAAWPWTAPIYAAAGLAVPVQGLVFEDTAATTAYEGGVPTLAVTAVLRNVSLRTRAVPPVEISLRGAESEDLFAWTVALPVEELESRQAVRFTAALARPPADVLDIELRLAPDAPRDGVPLAEAEIVEAD